MKKGIFKIFGGGESFFWRGVHSVFLGLFFPSVEISVENPTHIIKTNTSMPGPALPGQHCQASNADSTGVASVYIVTYGTWEVRWKYLMVFARVAEGHVHQVPICTVLWSARSTREKKHAKKTLAPKKKLTRYMYQIMARSPGFFSRRSSGDFPRLRGLK